ncbi:helix-turn-helix domain-containing protein [Streptomyces sp. NPDC021098]|uniref:helix-turn-helix domain-containing protein n=1 Tax=unclassified Streptomyces TaxID=2593676 RepID=UPI0037AC587B
MLIEQVFRSEDLAVADRFDYWRELMSRTHAPMDLSSDFAADYQAQQRLIELGEVSVWPATFQPLVFRRTPKLIRQSDPETFHLSLILHGHGGAIRNGSEATYGPYDFHSSDSSRPFEVRASQEQITTVVGLEVPKVLVPLPRDKADRAILHKLSGREGVGALLAQFVTRVADDPGSFRAADGPRLGMVAADLLSALLAHVLDTDSSLPPESRRRTLVLQIRSYVQRNLHDAELTPSVIAAAHHISLSYLHRLFEQEEETVAAWIRRLRLERARRDLADAALRATPIGVVAARWGFPRAADFTRSFRTAYGMPPKEYRDATCRPGK